MVNLLNDIYNYIYLFFLDNINNSDISAMLSDIEIYINNFINFILNVFKNSNDYIDIFQDTNLSIIISSVVTIIIIIYIFKLVINLFYFPFKAVLRGFNIDYDENIKKNKKPCSKVKKR